MNKTKVYVVMYSTNYGADPVVVFVSRKAAEKYLQREQDNNMFIEEIDFIEE